MRHHPRRIYFKANVTDRGEPGSMYSWRTQIWNKTTSEGNCASEGPPIYDSGSDATETTLGGGNIRVHM